MTKWQRFIYHPVAPMGPNRSMLTSCDAHIQLSRQAAAEGMVLLKNEGGLLPLRRGAKVALFSRGAVDYVKGGGGSSNVRCYYVRDMAQAFEMKAESGLLSVYQPLHAFYRENVNTQRSSEWWTRLSHTVEPIVPQELLDDAAANCDTAVICLCRFSTESYDRELAEYDGDFYLSKEEETMVSEVCARFDRVVLVLNIGGVIDTTWFRNNPKIQAVLLSWQGGTEGALAAADVLCGEVCPSGKLVDTFAPLAAYPSTEGFNESTEYINYTEDIFVGYRYFETIPGAAEQVWYPFGYGLSYTTFSRECLATSADAEQITVTMKVTNTGSVAGKEVLQLYTSAVGTRMDMPALELRAFAKTALLAPGASEEVTMTVPTGQIAVYDEAAAAWVIPAGEYRVRVGGNVRDLDTVCTYTVAQDVLVQQVQNRCVPKKLPCRLHSDGTYEQLEVGEYEPLYDTADWPEKLLWEAQNILPNNRGVVLPEDRHLFPEVAEGKITLDEFLAQFSDDELITLLGGCYMRGEAKFANSPVAMGGGGGLEPWGIPAVIVIDGPAGVRLEDAQEVRATAWPIGTSLACSWNTELVQQVGACIGLEILENNFGVWLGPGLNIHRNPTCGRNFEYYSEDPLISGKMAAAMIRGAQAQGISACAKHFCCNNKEYKRSWSDSRVSERALREIYLKGFEIVVKEGKVWSIMSSYNLLNGPHTSERRDLITGILREEWGYDGLVMSDWGNQAEHYREILAGNDLRMPFGSTLRLQKAMELGLITRDDLLVCCRRVLELILRLP